MKDSASVVIIGGGVAGTSVAYHLALSGKRDVLLLEQNTLASGSSSRSDGIVERQLLSEFDILLRVKSFKILAEFFKKGVDFIPIGYLRLTSNEKDVSKYLESVRIQKSLGVNDSRFLEPVEIKQILPFIRTDDLVGALYGPSDGMTDGSLLATTFAKEAEKLGARISQKTSLREIKRTSGEKKYRVVTSQGEAACDHIVNAAGAWAGYVGRLIGAEIPVKAVRRQIVKLEVPYQSAGRMPFFIDMKSRLYMHGSGGGKIVHCGLHFDEDSSMESEVDPNFFDGEVDFPFTEQVASALESRAPGLSGAVVKGGWAGLYEITPDSRPILGELPEFPGFYNCTGFSGYGIQLSPIAGKLLA
ncbi:MAG TPA: FAD-binding oxidoreductase, partial [Nitrososphaerales archaeon]|nr:FAD-binding oxidoreductase [Nitrososphaerales archaeon]